MSSPTTLQDRVAQQALPFSPDAVEALADRVMTDIGGSVQLLGLGEPTHRVEAFLQLRNRLFQRLVEAHGFTAIAIESSFPCGRLADDYVSGRRDALQMDAAFSYGMSDMAGNRELLEWMR